MVIKKEVKAAIITIAGLAMLIFGLNFLKGINLLSRSKKIYAVYNDIQGLVPANPVLVNGFHIGRVRDIEFKPGAKGKILVTLLITNTDARIPKNSVAEVVSLDFLGTKAVRLNLGNSNTFVEDGDTLIASTEQSLKEAVGQSVAPLKEKAEELISSIDSTMTIINGIFTLNTRNNLQQSVLNMRNTLVHIEATSESMEGLVNSQREKINSILTKIDEIAGTLSKNSQQISKMINNITGISDTLAKSKLKRAIDNAANTLDYTSGIFEKINKGKGNLGMLVNDTTLYYRLDHAALQLNELIEDIHEHPKRYVHFSVFGKKD
jgi:phospholipid/cholesterol/gamma-HCH transport system substrate-binding protein